MGKSNKKAVNSESTEFTASLFISLIRQKTLSLQHVPLDSQNQNDSEAPVIRL